MRKNVASQTVSFQMISTTDGSDVTTGTPAVYYTIDGGTQGTGAGTKAHEGNGQWSYVPAQAETNGNHVAFTMVLTGAISQTVNTWPVSFDPTDAADLGVTALTGHTPQTGDTYALANGAAGFVAIDTVVDGIQADLSNATDGLGAIKTDTAAILVDTGTTLPATLSSIVGYIDTEVAAILADTGTTLDGKIDAIKAITDQFVFTVANQVDANALAISGDTTAADNLELQYDGTGLTGDTYPSTQAQVGNLSVGTAALNVTASSFTKSGAEPETNTYTSTFALDGITHKVEDVIGVIDAYYEFDIGDHGVPVEFRWDGYCNIKDDIFNVYAYNYSTTSYEQVGSITGIGGTTIGTEQFPMTINHVGSGADIGKVRFRFTTSSGAAFATDRLLCSYAVVPITSQTRGAVSDATPTTSGFDTDLTQASEFWRDAVLEFTSGALSGQARTIQSYSATNGAIVFDEATTSTPANGDSFIIRHGHIHSITEIQSGLATEAKQDIIDTNVDAILADTNELQTDNIPATLATIAGYIDTEIGTIITNLATVDTVVDGIQTDLSNGTDGLGALKALIDSLVAVTVTATGEPGQGALPVSASMGDKINYLYKALRNKTTQTATTLSIYDDAGTTVDHKATVSDDGTTVTKGEIVTGP